MALNLTALRKFIKTALGAGDNICVELEDKHIEAAIEQAIDWWDAYHGWYLHHTLAVTTGVTEYDLSAVTPAVVDVTHVFFTLDPRLDLSGTWPGFLDVNGYPYDGFDHEQAQGGFYSGLVQWLQMRDTGARVLSADLDWFYNDKTNVITITPAEHTTGSAVIVYQTPFQKAFLPQIKPEHAMLIREYSLAWGKYILGRIRGKYTSGLPAAQGNVSLDGQELITEAREDFERLEQKLLDLMPPPGIVVG